MHTRVHYVTALELIDINVIHVWNINIQYKESRDKPLTKIVYTK